MTAVRRRDRRARREAKTYFNDAFCKIKETWETRKSQREEARRYKKYGQTDVHIHVHYERPVIEGCVPDSDEATTTISQSFCRAADADEISTKLSLVVLQELNRKERRINACGFHFAFGPEAYTPTGRYDDGDGMDVNMGEAPPPYQECHGSVDTSRGVQELWDEHDFQRELAIEAANAEAWLQGRGFGDDMGCGPV